MITERGHSAAPAASSSDQRDGSGKILARAGTDRSIMPQSSRTRATFRFPHSTELGRLPVSPTVSLSRKISRGCVDRLWKGVEFVEFARVRIFRATPALCREGADEAVRNLSVVGQIVADFQEARTAAGKLDSYPTAVGVVAALDERVKVRTYGLLAVSSLRPLAFQDGSRFTVGMIERHLDGPGIGRGSDAGGSCAAPLPNRVQGKSRIAHAQPPNRRIAHDCADAGERGHGGIIVADLVAGRTIPIHFQHGVGPASRVHPRIGQRASLDRRAVGHEGSIPTALECQ